MEAHIRRHVEEDVTGKLETDDEGDVVERRITRVTKRRIGNVFGQKQEKNVIEKRYVVRFCCFLVSDLSCE